MATVEDPTLRSFVAANVPWFYRQYRAPTDHRELAIEAFNAEASLLAPLGYRPSDDIRWEDPPRTTAEGRLLGHVLNRLFPKYAKLPESFLFVMFERTTEAR